MERGKGRGQATVEFALVLPLVIVFALIVVQAGLIANAQLLVSHAAREGARAASVEPTEVAASEAVNGATSLDPSRTSVSLDGGRSEGDRLGVTVDYLAPTDVPLVGWLVGDVRLTSKVTMRVE